METGNANDFRRTASAAFAQAGLAIEEGRLPLAAKALATVRDASDTLTAIDYGETEPASRYRAPGLGS